MLLLVRKVDTDDVKSIEIPDGESVSFLKELVQIEFGTTTDHQVLLFNDNQITTGTLLSNGLSDGNEILLSVSAKRERAICIGDIPPTASPDEILRLVEAHPHLLTQFKNTDAELGGVIESRDLGRLRTLMMKRYLSGHKRNYDHQQEIARMHADPTNAENQRKIQEMIRLEAINVIYC